MLNKEYVEASSRDPKMAMMFVGKSRAKRQSASGEVQQDGYSSAQTNAIKNRLKKSSSTEQQDPAAKNKTNGY